MPALGKRTKKVIESNKKETFLLLLASTLTISEVADKGKTMEF